DGRWHESRQSLSLRVVPRFWELRWVQVLASAMLIAGVVAGLALNERRKLHRKLERLEAHQALENERRRIARDLHDELGARLTSIALKGELAVQHNQLPTLAKSEVGALIGDVRRLIGATDEVIWTADPENDTLPNLVSFLGDYLERSLASTGVGYRLEVTPDLPDVPVAAQSRHNLLLAVKEAINNALRHAGAKIVRMEIDAQDARLKVRISDNGRGFDPGAPRSRGKGLENIKSRIALLNGNAEILSEVGKGTTVLLSMPLSAGHARK
ncbi:MAG: ATP-binding protein, partial [Chloroflexi bacterium]|nr:ATP-binding protein [Chloroflexota bacterium]